ncbi:TSPP1 [Auxenochlorella protothecoides x Auxenochlorella symbiontica]
MGMSRISFELKDDLEASPSGGILTACLEGSAASISPAYNAWKAEHPCPIQQFDSLMRQAAGKLVTVFLDYDGTLTPIVSNPEAATMSESTRGVVRRLAELFPSAIVSGRSRLKVQSFVQLAELFYAGSHGMDITGPAPGATAGAATWEDQVAFQPAAAFQPVMATLCEELEEAVRPFPGAVVENNTFCLSVHFRNCDAHSFPPILGLVEAAVASRSDQLRMTRGRKVLEIRPKLEWDKGTALIHLLGCMDLADAEQVFALYIGDDRTDEDAFKVLAERGLGCGILVSTHAKPTAASWSLHSPSDVVAFLEKLVTWGRSGANAWQSKRSCKGWHIAARPTAAAATPGLPPRTPTAPTPVARTPTQG